MAYGVCLFNSSPTAKPKDLTGWLEKRNGRPYNRWVRRWLTAGTPLELSNPTDFNVTEIDPADADLFAQVVREAYGFPPIKLDTPHFLRIKLYIDDS